MTLEPKLFRNESKLTELPQLKVICRRFTPVAGDRPTQIWVRDGEKTNTALPTYAISELQLTETASTLDRFVEYLPQILDRLRYLDDKTVSVIIAETVRAAEHVSTILRMIKLVY